jgi:ferritin
MSPKVVTALEAQAAHELAASQTYLAMAFWAEVNHFTGFATFFHAQAAEERGHALKILQHLADRGDTPRIAATPAPPTTFKGLHELAQRAYDLERANTAGIHAAYEVALAEKDYPAQTMLHWFISEQVEEEAWSDKMLVKTREATCAGALSSLDRHLTKELNKKAQAEA